MRIIGVTGGVGSGKTALLARIASSHNCKIISADQVANSLIEPDGPCYQEIIDLLGQDVLDAKGGIDKSKMAEIIFAAEDLLAKVNHIIHPAVKEYIRAQIAAAEKESKETAPQIANLSPGEADKESKATGRIRHCGFRPAIPLAGGLRLGGRDDETGSSGQGADRLESKRKIEPFFIEAALLIEDKYDKIVDELWYIYATEEVRLKRLMEKRGYSAAKALAIIRRQLTDAQFRAKCQVVIDNNAPDISIALAQAEERLACL